MGAFPVDRGASDIKAIRTCIEVAKERKLMIFPEGTRHDKGNAKAGVGLIALKANCEITPIYISEVKMFSTVHIIVGKSIKKPEGKITAAEFSDYILKEIYKIGEEHENRNC